MKKNLMDLEYEWSQQISNSFKNKIPNLFIIFFGIPGWGITTTLGMSGVHLKSLGHNPIRIYYIRGTKEFEKEIKNYDVVIYEELLRANRRKNGQLTAKSKKECQILHDSGCSIISAIGCNPKTNNKGIIKELNKLGFNVIEVYPKDRTLGIESIRLYGIGSTKAIDLFNRINEIPDISFVDQSDEDLEHKKPLSYVIPIYMDNEKIYEIENFLGYGWEHSKVLICPHCYGRVTLGKNEGEKLYSYKPFSNIPEYYSTLHIKNEKGFKIHMGKCPPAFEGDGFFEVITDKQKNIIDEICYLSKHEAGWDSRLINKEYYDKGQKVFVYAKNNIPLGYVAFRKKKFIVEQEHKHIFNLSNEINGIETYVLWDLYTFPFFRKKRIASYLIEYAKNKLNLDGDYLAVSMPVTSSAKELIIDSTNKYFIGYRDRGYLIIEKEELVRIGKIKEGTIVFTDK